MALRILLCSLWCCASGQIKAIDGCIICNNRVKPWEACSNSSASKCITLKCITLECEGQQRRSDGLPESMSFFDTCCMFDIGMLVLQGCALAPGTHKRLPLFVSVMHTLVQHPAPSKHLGTLQSNYFEHILPSHSVCSSGTFVQI